jgi:hypothetical protein
MAPPLPPGFVIQGQQRSSVPPLPPGFVIQASPTPDMAPRRLPPGVFPKGPSALAQERALMPVEELARDVRGQPQPPPLHPGRRTAADVGAGLDPLSRQRLLEEGEEQTAGLLTDAAAGAVGAAGGGLLGRFTGAVGRWLGRGARSRQTVDQLVRQFGETPTGRSFLADLGKEIGQAGAVATLVDLGPELVPGGEDIAPEAGEDTIALLGALASLRQGSTNLLLAHPKFRSWALGAARGRRGATFGALVGIAAAEGGDIGRAITEFIQKLEGEDRQ